MKHTERMEDLVVAERAAEWLQRLEQGGPEVHAEFGGPGGISATRQTRARSSA